MCTPNELFPAKTIVSEESSNTCSTMYEHWGRCYRRVLYIENVELANCIKTMSSTFNMTSWLNMNIFNAVKNSWIASLINFSLWPKYRYMRLLAVALFLPISQMRNCANAQMHIIKLNDTCCGDGLYVSFSLFTFYSTLWMYWRALFGFTMYVYIFQFSFSSQRIFVILVGCQLSEWLRKWQNTK